MRKNSIVVLMLTLVFGAAAEQVKIESSRLRVTFDANLSGIASILDKQSGREYLNPADSHPGLYEIAFWPSAWEVTYLAAAEAVRRDVTQTATETVITFHHQGAAPLDVICRIRANPHEPAVSWNIQIENRSAFTLEEIHFPLAPFTRQLGTAFDDDAIVYPRNEGMILCKPRQYLKKGKEVRFIYPGELSAQFVYYYDREGGLFLAAQDGQGHRKSAEVSGAGSTLALKFIHYDYIKPGARWKLPYEVSMQAGEGCWQAGADIYKNWAVCQSWCANTISRRPVPAWLQQPRIFLNFSANHPHFFPAEQADAIFRKYHDFFGQKIMATAFSWEKNGAWMSPDYFPPIGGEAHYRRLAQLLGLRGDRLHLFTSGFRWGVRRTENAKDEYHRDFSDYDGNQLFLSRGADVAALQRDATFEFYQNPWADNYRVCVGSDFRKTLTDIFAQCFALGAYGVDLDQDIGSEGAVCYSSKHDHPSGAGLWIHQAMEGFVKNIYQSAKNTNPDYFIGSEEICEIYIPHFDIYHGRIFTDYDWPAQGPGAMAIPLFAYLYHEYILSYGGFSDRLFSPAENPLAGLGRSFIFGMQPGIRIAGGFDIDSAEGLQNLSMVKRYAGVLAKMNSYLLLGKMLKEPVLHGIPYRELPQIYHRIRMEWPQLPWPEVQATTWLAADGNVCYAVCNISDKTVNFELEASPFPDGSALAQLSLVKENQQILLMKKTPLPKKISLTAEPWALFCVEQKRLTK